MPRDAFRAWQGFLVVPPTRTLYSIGKLLSVSCCSFPVKRLTNTRGVVAFILHLPSIESKICQTSKTAFLSRPRQLKCLPRFKIPMSNKAANRRPRVAFLLARSAPGYHGSEQRQPRSRNCNGQ